MRMRLVSQKRELTSVPERHILLGCPPYQVVNDIRAFECPLVQAEYIKQYVPASFDEPRWVEFLTRAWAWFRGRYRSTATLISLILEGGYQYPTERSTSM